MEKKKKKGLGDFSLKPESVEALFASMHRADKAPIVIWHFRAAWSKSGRLVSSSMTIPTYGLAHSASTFLSQKAICCKSLTEDHIRKKTKTRNHKNKRVKGLHCEQEGIEETSDTDWRQRNQKEETVVQKKSFLGSRLESAMTHCLQCQAQSINVCVKRYGECTV